MSHVDLSVPSSTGEARQPRPTSGPADPGASSIDVVEEGRGPGTVPLDLPADEPVEPGALDGATEMTAEHDGYFGVDASSYAGNPSGEDFLVGEELIVEFDAGTFRFTVPEETSVVTISADSPWTLDIR